MRQEAVLPTEAVPLVLNMQVPEVASISKSAVVPECLTVPTLKVGKATTVTFAVLRSSVLILVPVLLTQPVKREHGDVVPTDLRVQQLVQSKGLLMTKPWHNSVPKERLGPKGKVGL